MKSLSSKIEWVWQGMFVRKSNNLGEVQVILCVGRGGRCQEMRIENSVSAKLQMPLDHPKRL